MEKVHNSNDSAGDSSDTDYKTVDSPRVVETEAITRAVPFEAARTKKLLRKLDLNLVPFLALLYL